MRVLAIALGGCLRAPPVPYGMTEDTGGHIAYILGAMAALARDPRVTRADIATRLFDEPALGRIHAATRESIGPKSEIVRIDSGDRRYLAKEDLARDRDAFTRALIAHLRGADHLPDIIHAHFADAAPVISPRCQRPTRQIARVPQPRPRAAPGLPRSSPTLTSHVLSGRLSKRFV